METKKRCLIELEDCYGAKEVKPRVQAWAVKLIRKRRVSITQASRDLGVHQTVLRKWTKDVADDPIAAFQPPPYPRQKRSARP